MLIIRATERRRMPWKNGGGETMEIAVSPDGAPLDDFDWRISTAHVGASGPFSIFPGVDRTLSVLGPAGIQLDFGDRGIVRLDRASAPYRFPADLAVEGRLLDGPIDDVNVMTRRGRCRHHVARRQIDTPLSLSRRGDVTVILLVQGALKTTFVERSVLLAAGDAVVLDDVESGIDLAPDVPSDLFVIDLWRD